MIYLHLDPSSCTCQQCVYTTLTCARDVYSLQWCIYKATLSTDVNEKACGNGILAETTRTLASPGTARKHHKCERHFEENTKNGKYCATYQTVWYACVVNHTSLTITYVWQETTHERHSLVVRVALWLTLGFGWQKPSFILLLGDTGWPWPSTSFQSALLHKVVKGQKDYSDFFLEKGKDTWYM